MKKISLLIICIAVVSCGIKLNPKETVHRSIALGSIGFEQGTFHKIFQETAQLNPVEPLQLNVVQLLESEKDSMGKDISRKVRLSLSDHPKLLEQLNQQQELKEYLAAHPTARLIISITIKLNKEQLDLFDPSNTYFLKLNAQRELMIGGYTYQATDIPVKSLTVIDYTTSSICWGQNSYRDPMIMGISTTSKCSGALERDPADLKNTVSY